MLLSVFFVPVADAYPFMIRHGYTACAQCHVDPSGGGALTDYGRGQAEILLTTPWGKRGADWEPSETRDFLFGAGDLPEWSTLQFDMRSLVIPEPSNFRWILMQADLRGAVDVGKLKAYASVGYVNAYSQTSTATSQTAVANGAWITSNDTGGAGNLVSREHWVGVDVAKGLLVRAGRMAIPFGLRSEEHELYTRQTTRSDVNDTQQVGLDAVYQGKGVRAEGMVIAGNYQIRPDAYRERGYSALLAYSPSKISELGVSSQSTWAVQDVETFEDKVRQAHGVFGRYAPFEKLVLMGEHDLLVDLSASSRDTMGLTGYLQADVEVTQGFHVRATGEYCERDFEDAEATNLSAWATAQWFFDTHADVRIDGIYGTLDCAPGAEPMPMGLAQIHFFL